MKTIVIFLILGAVVACGGAFFGMFTIPGFENFPTVEKLGKDRQHQIEVGAQQRFNGTAPLTGGAKSAAGLGARATKMQDAQGSLK